MSSPEQDVGDDEPSPSPEFVLDAFARHVEEPLDPEGGISALMLGLSTDFGEAVSVMLEHVQLGAEGRLALAEKLCDFACDWTRLCDAFGLRPSSVAQGVLPAVHEHVHMPFKDRSLTAMRMVTACGAINQIVDKGITGDARARADQSAALRAAWVQWATLCHQCGLNWRHVLGLAAGSGKEGRSQAARRAQRLPKAG